jgi:O-acetyl-ADP-ribose deacetylase (regulator of RNase III)
LKRSVLEAAGLTVPINFTDGTNISAQTCVTASAGMLPCKKIIFVPWTPGFMTTTNLEDSIKMFVATSVQKAEEIGCNTLAFPAIG